MVDWKQGVWLVAWEEVALPFRRKLFPAKRKLLISKVSAPTTIFWQYSFKSVKVDKRMLQTMHGCKIIWWVKLAQGGLLSPLLSVAIATKYWTSNIGLVRGSKDALKTFEPIQSFIWMPSPSSPFVCCDQIFSRSPCCVLWALSWNTNENTSTDKLSRALPY